MKRTSDGALDADVAKDDGALDDGALKAYLSAVGARVREARARRGMARRILARDSGVSERYLAQLESGNGNPTITVLRQIARAVDYPLSDLVMGADLVMGQSDASARGHGDSDGRLGRILAQVRALPSGRLDALERFLAETPNATENPDKRRRLSLIGLRGAGKSTLGRRLSERLKLPFVEINRLIEQEYGGSVGEIMALSGQPAFRRYERRALEAAVAENEAAVIATGGGIVSEAETFSYLLEHTFTIWIKASPEEHMGRVIAQGDLRPMAKNDEAMEDLKAILAARESFYRRADAVVDTSGRTVEESLGDLEEVARKLLG